MIIIVNQHRGTFNELMDNINNYLKMHSSNKWYQILMVDEVTDRPYDYLTKFFDALNSTKGDKIKVIYKTDDSSNDYMRNGLSQCRWKCMVEAHNKFNVLTELDLFLFGCTNSSFEVKLTDALHDYLVNLASGYTLISDCLYPSHDEISKSWTHKFDYYDRVKVEDFINCQNRPDCSIFVPYWLFLKDYDTYEFTYSPFVNSNEKYNPEDLIWLYGADTSGYIRHIHTIELNDLNKYFQLAWHNNNGMSATFSRKTVLDNKTGFYNRAEVILKLWLNNEFKLESNTLKNLVYDLVTLKTLDMHKWSGTILEPLITWALNKWISNPNYSHKIKFIE